MSEAKRLLEEARQRHEACEAWAAKNGFDTAMTKAPGVFKEKQMAALKATYIRADVLSYHLTAEMARLAELFSGENMHFSEVDVVVGLSTALGKFIAQNNQRKTGEATEISVKAMESLGVLAKNAIDQMNAMGAVLGMTPLHVMGAIVASVQAYALSQSVQLDAIPKTEDGPNSRRF